MSTEVLQQFLALDSQIYGIVQEQAALIAAFIDFNTDRFTAADVAVSDAKPGQRQVMLQMPFQSASGKRDYYYFEGNFYHYLGYVDVTFHSPPRIVHLVEGWKLRELLQGQSFVRSIIGLPQTE
ncbi:MAG: hypothetical protein Q7S09_00405 [bacterium]|nr:hypothetical protein [bacterium]